MGNGFVYVFEAAGKLLALAATAGPLTGKTSMRMLMNLKNLVNTVYAPFLKQWNASCDE
jgi:hypothetical protein